MYSVVLMTALATASASPQFGNRHGCHAYSACHGCYSTSSGCYTYRAPVHGYGAAGGCYGYHGGCYSAFGVVQYVDPAHQGGGCTGCYGCYGGHSCYGIPVPIANIPVVRTHDPFPPINPPDKKKGVKDAEEVAPPKEKPRPGGKDDKKPQEENSQARAKVRIDVPVGGKLFVDGRHINVAPGLRTFQTPMLTAGESFYYDVRIEVERNGLLNREERRVIVRSGEDVAVRFENLTPSGTTTALAPR